MFAIGKNELKALNNRRHKIIDELEGYNNNIITFKSLHLMQELRKIEAKLQVLSNSCKSIEDTNDSLA